MNELPPRLSHTPISGEDQPPGDLYPPLAVPSDTFTPTRGECHTQVDSISRAAHCWEGSRAGLRCFQALDACAAAGVPSRCPRSATFLPVVLEVVSAVAKAPSPPPEMALDL